METWDTNEEALSAQLLDRLQDRKYLIVMNDMSTAEELFDLQTYLPDQSNGSKLIVTSCEAMVAKEIKEQDYYESDVCIFLENLKQLMSSGLDFVASQRDELQIVYEYIKEMSMLIKLTEEKGSADMAIHVRDVVFEAENIVDTFIFGSVSSSGGGDLSTKLESVKGEMDTIIKFSKDGIIKFELEWWYMKAAESTTHAVGLRPQINKIMRRFKHGKSLEIISILGFPGIGKTTLAKKIYDDHCTIENFEIQAWIKVSQGGYTKRDLPASILESFDPIFKENWDAGEEALGGLLLEHLQDHNYLIVMDDMRSAQALFDLQTYLLDQCNGSKIIVTTPEPMVAMAIKEQACYESYAIRLDPLSEEDSWELFQSILLGHQTSVSKELEEFGKNFVKQCHGLPLAIAVISGFLARKSKTPSLWGSSARTLAIFEELYMGILACRYNQLPPHLKACLLYIGSFPEHYAIALGELVLLFIAEGFITEEAVGIAGSPEAVAEGYISDLVDRCLVTVSYRRPREKDIRCCTIVSLVRAFCSAKSEESKFAYKASATQSDPRRLFLSCERCTIISLEASEQTLRSLQCCGISSGYFYFDYQASIERIFCGNDFKLVKVLNFLSLGLLRPYEIGVMVHLTYLAVGWDNVPESITNLFNLETLVLDGRDFVIRLPSGILKMDKLRRVFNKAGALCFSRSDLSAGIAGNLQTVCPLCACWTCRQVLTKSPRIRKLSLCHNGSVDLDSLLGNLSFLEDLETLKCGSNWMNLERRCNSQIQIPSSIKRLTLRSTFLKWEMISVLRTLPNLEVLKLLQNAFSTAKPKGAGSSCWDIRGQEFPRLKWLKMAWLDITMWVGDDDDVQFKSLEVLSIVGCGQLRMLPSGLARAPRLCTVEVKSCNSYVEGFFDSYL